MPLCGLKERQWPQQFLGKKRKQMLRETTIAFYGGWSQQRQYKSLRVPLLLGKRARHSVEYLLGF